MKIAQVVNYKVVGIFNWESLPPELVGNPQYHILPEELVSSVDVGWKYSDGQFLAGEAEIENWGTKITKLAFLNRLGDNVLVAIESASRVNNPLGIAASVIKIKHSSASYIDLALPETATDVGKLVTLGFLTEEAFTVVLSAPVQEKEVPYGYPKA